MRALPDVRPELRCERGEEYIPNPDVPNPTVWHNCVHHPKCNRGLHAGSDLTKFVCGRFPEDATRQFWTLVTRMDER